MCMPAMAAYGSWDLQEVHLHQSSLCRQSTDFKNGTGVLMVLAKGRRPQMAKERFLSEWAQVTVRLAVAINFYGKGWWATRQVAFNSFVAAVNVMLEAKIIAISPRVGIRIINGDGLPAEWQSPKAIREWMLAHRGPDGLHLCPDGITAICHGRCAYAKCYVRSEVAVNDADPCATCIVCHAFHPGVFCGVCGMPALHTPPLI